MCLCLETQKYNVARQYNMCLTGQIVGTTLNEEDSKKMYAQFVCVPMPEWNYVCLYFLYVVALFWHIAVSWLLTEDSK